MPNAGEDAEKPDHSYIASTDPLKNSSVVSLKD